MEANLSKLKQTAKHIDFQLVSDDLGGELARQRLQKESPKSHDSPEESSWRKRGSKMEHPEKLIDFPLGFDDFWGELAGQLLKKESPKSHDSPEESSWRKLGSKMELNEATSNNHWFSSGF